MVSATFLVALPAYAQRQRISPPGRAREMLQQTQPPPQKAARGSGIGRWFNKHPVLGGGLVGGGTVAVMNGSAMGVLAGAGKLALMGKGLLVLAAANPIGAVALGAIGGIMAVKGIAKFAKWRQNRAMEKQYRAEYEQLLQEAQEEEAEEMARMAAGGGGAGAAEEARAAQEAAEEAEAMRRGAGGAAGGVGGAAAAEAAALEAEAAEREALAAERGRREPEMEPEPEPEPESRRSAPPEVVRAPQGRGAPGANGPPTVAPRSGPSPAAGAAGAAGAVAITKPLLTSSKTDGKTGTVRDVYKMPDGAQLRVSTWNRGKTQMQDIRVYDPNGKLVDRWRSSGPIPKQNAGSSSTKRSVPLKDGGELKVSTWKQGNGTMQDVRIKDANGTFLDTFRKKTADPD